MIFFQAYNAPSAALARDVLKNSEFKSLGTKPSFSVFLVANSKTLSKDARLEIAGLVNQIFQNHTFFDGETRSFELLPPLSFGSLGLKAPLIAPSEMPFKAVPKKIRFERGSASSNPLIQKIEDALISRGIELLPPDKSGDGKSIFDLKFMGQGMNANFPEIELFLNSVSSSAFIEMSQDEKLALSELSHTTDLKSRSVGISSLTKALLEDGRVTPIVVRGYDNVFRVNTLDIEKMVDFDGDILFSKMKVRN